MHILLVFIKNPRLGYVKTRLAATLGDAEALRIYHQLLEKTRVAALDCAARKWLFYSDYVETNDGWPESVFEKKTQSPGDLGERMRAAFEQAFSAGAQKVLIIGSDCPEMNGALLDAAFAQLNDADFVIGPATDGGYYLIGMRAYAPAVFEGVAWSSETVLSSTIAKIDALGRVYALLPTLTDVDTEADWLKAT